MCCFHPFCGNNRLLTTGVKIIGIFEMIVYGMLSILMTIFIGISLTFVVIGAILGHYNEIPSFPVISELPGFSGIYVLFAAIFAFLVLSYFLFRTRISYRCWKGAEEGDERKCQTWLIINATEFITCLAILLFSIFAGVAVSKINVNPFYLYVYGHVVEMLAVTVVRFYFVWIVCAFITVTEDRKQLPMVSIKPEVAFMKVKSHGKH